MRHRISDRNILLVTYLLLILFFWQAQSVVEPFEQSIRAQLAQPMALQPIQP